MTDLDLESNKRLLELLDKVRRESGCEKCSVIVPEKYRDKVIKMLVNTSNIDIKIMEMGDLLLSEDKIFILPMKN